MDKAYWDEIEKRWTGEFECFTQWFAKYRIENSWDSLYIHFLPDAMQIGVFYQYAIEESHFCDFLVAGCQTIEGLADDIKEWFCEETDAGYQDHLVGKYMDEIENENTEHE